MSAVGSAASARAGGGAAAALARLLAATLRLRDPVPSDGLAARWRALTPRAAEAMGRTVDHEGAAAWLLRRLGDRGLLASAPRELLEGLRRRARRDAAQAMRVDAQADAVLARLAEWDVPAVLLKGVARRAASGLYPYADARATLDVDLLVEAGAAGTVEGRLRESGYAYAAPAGATPAGHHHRRPLTLGGEPTVELHTSTSAEVTAAEAWRRAVTGATELEWLGRRVRVPGATELLWHATAHALHEGPRAFRLRHWLDAAVVLASGRPIAWATVGERLRGPEVPDRDLALLWLLGAAELAGSRLPVLLGSAAGAPGRAMAAPSPVVPALAWRLAVMRRHPDESPWRAKLLDEGARAQLGLPCAPLDPSRAAAVGVRRRAASLAGRGLYHLWRSAGGAA